jgi:hypothetical protein
VIRTFQKVGFSHLDRGTSEKTRQVSGRSN